MADFWILLAAMAITTYLVRMIPFALFRSRIKSKFLRDFLYYIPYAVLGAMTLPYIFYAGGSVASSAVGFVAAFIAAYFRLPLLPVAVVSCICTYISSIWI